MKISRLSIETLLLGIIMMCSSVNVLAAPIQYRFSWVGSGSTTQSFENIEAHMQFNTQTTNVFTINNPGGHYDSIGFISGDFSGAGISGQVSPLVVANEHFDSGESRMAFFGYEGGEFWTGIKNPAIDGYDMRSAIGPVSSTEPLGAGQITLDSGLASLNFSSVSSVTFEAIVPTAVPEPAPLWLFGSGLLGLIGISRHKKTS